ncbi:hypothetical protein BC829DRAFT_423745, partial [Chytridium lagenaria]
LEVNESYGGFEYRPSITLVVDDKTDCSGVSKRNAGNPWRINRGEDFGKFIRQEGIDERDGVIGITSGNVSNGRLPYLGMGEVSAVPMDRIKTGWIQEDKLARGGFWEGERLHASSQQF